MFELDYKLYIEVVCKKGLTSTIFTLIKTLFPFHNLEIEHKSNILEVGVLQRSIQLIPSVKQYSTFKCTHSCSTRIIHTNFQICWHWVNLGIYLVIWYSLCFEQCLPISIYSRTPHIRPWHIQLLLLTDLVNC